MKRKIAHLFLAIMIVIVFISLIISFFEWLDSNNYFMYFFGGLMAVFAVIGLVVLIWFVYDMIRDY